jgi:HEAT repeat protein
VGFQTITTKKPWYKKPGSIFALAMFVVLGAIAGFLLKGDEKTLCDRVKAEDPISAVCAAALGFRGVKEEATRDAMEQILASGLKEKKADDNLRRACAYALGSVKSKHPLSVLVDALQKDPAVPVRCTAAVAIGKAGEADGADPLIAAVADQDAEVRAAAAEGCELMGDKRAIDKLIDKTDDPVPQVRQACHRALVKLTGQSFDGTDEKRLWRTWREKN